MASISMVISWSDAKISWRLTSMTCSPRFSRTSHQTNHFGSHCSRSESIWLREHHCIQSVHDWQPCSVQAWLAVNCRQITGLHLWHLQSCHCVIDRPHLWSRDHSCWRLNPSLTVFWFSRNTSNSLLTYLLTYCIALWLYCFDSTWQSCISCWCFVYEGFE